MNFMFDGCNSLKSLPDISKWNRNNIIKNNIINESFSSELLPEISKKNFLKKKLIDYKNTLLPKTKEENKLRIFGNIFVKNNKDKCKIKYNNEEHELKEFFEVSDSNYNKKDIISFTLIGINNITDMSHMFEGCDSLVDKSYLNNLKFNSETNEILIGTNVNYSLSKETKTQFEGSEQSGGLYDELPNKSNQSSFGISR